MKFPFSVIALLAAASMLTFGLSSCGGDDPDDPTPVTPSGPNAQPNPDTPLPDPAGTVEVNLLIGENGFYVAELGGRLYLKAGNNLYYSDGHIICVDAVNSLANISTLPGSGWAAETAAKAGCGYVLRKNCYDYTNEQWGYKYCRLYVQSYIEGVGGIAGVVVKYQSPWEPDVTE